MLSFVWSAVTGRSVKPDWHFNDSCTTGSLMAVPPPNQFHITSSFGYSGDQLGAVNGSAVIDGVPRGTHTIAFTGIRYPDVRTSTTLTVVVQL